MPLQMRNNPLNNIRFLYFFIILFSLNNCKAQNNVSEANFKSEALVIIDTQEGFFSNPEYPIYNEKILVQNINSLIDHFRNHHNPIIFVRHIDNDLVKGTTAWQVYSKLHSKPEDIYVEKTTPDSFFETNLLSVIKENNINSIVIAGLQTDYCIDTTCRSAFGKDIPVTLASDAHSTYDNSYMTADKIIDYHNGLIGSWFAQLKATKEIIQ